MKIGIAGPMSLELLKFDYGNRKIPYGYPFPMISFFINGLLDKGFKVVAYTYSEDINEPTVFESDNLIICVARRGVHPGRDFFHRARKDIKFLINKYPVDIINAHWTYEFAWAALGSNIPSVITIHDYAWTIFKLNPIPFRFIKLIMNNIVLRKAQYLTANSPYIYSLLNSNAKYKTKIIPDFYTKELEYEFDLNREKEKYILTISNGYGKRKNIENGIIAFSYLRKKRKNIYYKLIGQDMEFSGPAFKFAETNGLLEGIDFMGSQPFNKVIDLIKNARIYLHPSREESFGMSILEAMVLGTVVIGGEKSGNVANLLDNGNAGILCDVENPNDICNKMEVLLEDEKMENNLKIAAHLHAKKNYSEEVVIPKFLAYYQNILNQ